MLRITIIFFLAVQLLGGCKNQTQKPEERSPDGKAAVQYPDPPSIDVGLTVDQAYAAIPHRKTVWTADDSTVASEEKAYLNTMFQVVDQGVTVRVAGLQNFTNGHFNTIDVSEDFDRLVTFVRGMTPPKGLAAYHHQILSALTSEREFFNQWESHRDSFPFAHQIANDPNVQAASAASRAAYNELMMRYPRESQRNKDAFYDYHCALDFL